MKKLPSVSIIIPTYRREAVLLQTLQELLSLRYRAQEILVVDQTEEHGSDVENALMELNQGGDIRWIKLPKPSIPNAMNHGAVEAVNEIVLFLDDDILVPGELVEEHARAYLEPNTNGVAGQVIQSWQSELPKGEFSYLNNQTDDPDAFRFNSANAMQIRRFSGGNVSFRRHDLIDVGGFDNNFARVAYRFEAECAERFVSAGKILMFIPSASIHHLKELSGGTRTFGDHRTTIKPSHSVGRYYYFLVVKNQHRRWRRFFLSPFSSCATKYHLSHPWMIPVTFIAEVSGMLWALKLKIHGQKLIDV